MRFESGLSHFLCQNFDMNITMVAWLAYIHFDVLRMQWTIIQNEKKTFAYAQTESALIQWWFVWIGFFESSNELQSTDSFDVMATGLSSINNYTNTVICKMQIKFAKWLICLTRAIKLAMWIETCFRFD